MTPNDDLISKTKIILPKRRLDLLTRPRLLEILYERLDRKLIIISAAAGYGKTSLLVDLASHSELPFCWLSLDPLDSDPQQFIGSVIASLGERFPGFGKRSRSLLSGMTNLDDGMERVLVTLVNEIYDEIHEHFVLVLDDFHVLDECQPVLYFVNRFIQLVGENCHVILASRTLPPLQDIPLLVAREEVGGLDFSDLSFTPAEIQALLAQNRQIHVSEEQAQKLVDATEGWITGLQFADLGDLTGQQGAQPFRTPGRVGVTVFDYLGQQVLQQQPADVQMFMKRSAMLEEFNVELCAAVLGPLYEEEPAWSDLIETILQKNLFTQPIGPSGQWIRYHHLFRDYLQSQLREDCPEDIEPILRRLAGFHESNSQWEKAYQTYTRLGDPQALASLVERAGIPMYQHAVLTLESWLKALPPSEAENRPGLLSLRGNIEVIKGNPSEAILLFDRAVEAYQHTPPSTAQILNLSRRANAYRFVGRYDELLRDVQEILKSTEAKDDLQWIRADALRLNGLRLLRLGHSQEAIRDLERALEIYVRIHDAASIPLLLMETGVAYGALGNYASAKASYEKALAAWREDGNLPSQAFVLNNLGFLHQQLGEYEEAVHNYEEGLLCARRSGTKRSEALILLGLGDVYSEIEDVELAAQNYRQAGDMIEQIAEPFLQNYLAIAEANLALTRGNVDEAQQRARRAAETVLLSPSNYEKALLHLLNGRILLKCARASDALAPLKEAKQLFAADGREMESLWTAVWLGAAEYECGQLSEAYTDIRNAVADPARIRYAAVLAARQASAWLARLRKDPEIRVQVRGLFDKADRLDARLPALRRQIRRLAHTIEVPTPSLIIRAFGPGQVWLNGKAVSAKDWQTQSVRELFFFLLFTGRPLSRDQVGNALWPGTEDPARLKMRFKNEMYRLRRAVGQDTILFDGETYRFDASVDHEYDVEAFEAFLKKARGAARVTDQISLYEKAINLVQGRYLEDINATWVVAEQERLHQAFLTAVISVAGLYQKEGQTPKAVEVCQRALALDRTAEVIYRLLMQVFARMGDKASVLHVYKTCEQHMQLMLQMEPSHETQDLCRALTS